jgi:hypothetical protein
MSADGRLSGRLRGSFQGVTPRWGNAATLRISTGHGGIDLISIQINRGLRQSLTSSKNA